MSIIIRVNEKTHSDFKKAVTLMDTDMTKILLKRIETYVKHVEHKLGRKMSEVGKL